MNYPTLLEIKYKDDIEYRKCVRQLFSMHSQQLEWEDPNIVDPVSLDENDYDIISSSMMLDHIYNSTKEIPLFINMYIHAAGFMISEDQEIGLVVLCSYDYLIEFHNCLCDFFTSPDTFSQSRDSLKQLNNKLGYSIV